MNKYFVGGNGERFTVPEGDVEGFLKSATDEGLTVSEEKTRLFTGKDGAQYDVPESDVEGFLKSAKEEGLTVSEEQPSGAHEGPDYNDPKYRVDRNFGDITYEPLKEAAKGAGGVIASVLNPIGKAFANMARGAGNLTAVGTVMPNGIIVNGGGATTKLGFAETDPDKFAERRRNNGGEFLGEKLDAAVDAVVPYEKNDNPVTAGIQKVGEEVGNLAQFMVAPTGGLMMGQFGKQWDAHYDEYIKEGRTPAEAAAYADAGGAVGATFDAALKAIPVTHFLKKGFGFNEANSAIKTLVNKLGNIGEREVVGVVGKDIAKDILANAAFEAVSFAGISGAQTFIDNCIEQQGATGEIDVTNALSATFDAMKHGGATGAIMGTVARLPRASVAVAAGRDVVKAQKSAEVERVEAARTAHEEAEQARAQGAAEQAAKEEHRAKVSAVKGEQDGAKQMAAVEEMGVASWEQAEAEGLVTKDEQGRYTGGARRTVNILVNGTEALKGAVREGKISAEVAEEILTLSQCEMGARSAEERAKLIDAIVETAGGDEALARGIVEKIAARDEGQQAYDSKFVETIAAEVKAEALAKAQGIDLETARGATVEPVETADGKITTTGEVVGTKVEKVGRGGENAEPTAQEKAEFEATKIENRVTIVGGICGELKKGLVFRHEGDKTNEIWYELGSTGKRGMGAMHIIENRMAKDGATLDEAAEIAVKVGFAAALGKETLKRYNTTHYDWNGIRAIVATMPDGRRVITGYEISADAGAGANRRSSSLHATPHVSSEEAVAALKRASDRIGDATLSQLRPRTEPSTVNSIANSGTEVKGPKPQTALEGVEQAARLKGTKLTSVQDGTLGCKTFPKLMVEVSSEGVDIRGLDAVEMAKPENAADLAAVLVQAQRIANRNGIALRFESEEAMRAAEGIARQVEEQGLARAQKWMDTRAKTLGLLMKNGLGTEVTYDEASFKAALASTENGRPFVDKHGDIYGFVDGKGGIHFNPAKLTMDIPFHENGHLAIAVAKKVNGKLIERGFELIKDTEYYREIAEMAKQEGHPYHGLDEAGICEDALCNLLGRRMKDIIADKGVGAGLKQWVKDFWKAVKGALGIADLTEEQIENMTLEEIADAIGSELVSGREFGVRRRPSGLTRSEAAKARMKREEDAHYQEQAEAEEEAQREAFIASGGTALDYIKQRIAESEGAPFDLDWETMRELARDRAEGKFAAVRGAEPANQDKKYGYEALTAKPPMKVKQYGTAKVKRITVDGHDKIDTGDLIKKTIGAIREGGVSVAGKPAVHVADLGRDVIVDEASLRHARPLEIARFPDIFANYGDILANSIVVNEATSAAGRSSGELVALGMAYNRAGRPVFVRSVIDSRNGADKISKMEVVYAVDARKGNSASHPTPSRFTSDGKQSRAHVDDGIAPSSVSKGETAISISDLLEMSKGVFGDIFSRDVNARLGLEREGTKLGNSLKFSVSPVYTGSAADYDRPSLLKVGTGEGSQVYGWGLYGSGVKGVAKDYAETIRDTKLEETKVLIGGKTVDENSVSAALGHIVDYFRYHEGTKKDFEDALMKWRKHDPKSALYAEMWDEWNKIKDSIEIGETPTANIYEQTFFTNRAAGDESHLLSWYEPVSEENKRRILDELAKSDKNLEGQLAKLDKANADAGRKVKEAISNGLSLESMIGIGGIGDAKRVVELFREQIGVNGSTGADVYKALQKKLGSPKVASEFLARADIDGIKYPVDSYGGKTIKDGGTAGWNYVSFRDDNITVDHKWVDGELKFAVGPGAEPANRDKKYGYEVLTAKPPMKLTAIDPSGFKNYKNDGERVREARKSVVEAGGKTANGVTTIDMQGLPNVIIGANGIKHRGKNRNLENDMLYPVLGPVLKNAIPINELMPRTSDKNVVNTYVYLGAFAYGNEVCPVRIQVAERNGENKIETIDVLKSLNTKVGKLPAPGKTDLEDAAARRVVLGNLPEISIANLIEIAQPLHPEIFSRNVTDALGAPYRGDGINAKFAAGKKDQTETQQFKNWFAGSKVVDDAGKPLVVYHGTPETFTAFDKGRIKSTNYGKGFYFTSDRADAEHYANGGNVMPVYLSVKNPLDITTSKNDAEFNKWYGKKNSPYDGYIVNFDGKKMIVVTEPTQIKSATDNIGTFDAGNPDIRFAAGPGAGRGVTAEKGGISQETASKRDKINEELGLIEKAKDAAGQNREGFYRAVNKTFGANHTFEMGKPEGMLKGNLPDKPIVLTLKTLLRKRSEAYKNRHPFEFAEVKDIVEKVHNPALLLKNANGQPGVREFFEATSGRAFMVAIRPNGEINDIATLFPKDYERLVKMIKTLDRRDILGVDTEKATRMLKSRYNTASAKDTGDLSDAISLLNSVGGSQGGKEALSRKIEEELALAPHALNASTPDNIPNEGASGQGGKFAAGRGDDWKGAFDTGSWTWKKPGEGEIAMGESERRASGIAAGIERREALRPWTKAGSPADTAKPIAFDAADMVMFWRAVSGSLKNPHVQKGERIKGRKNAVGLNVGGGQIEIVSKLFGVIDQGDVAALKDECRAAGFFRNEDTDWCGRMSKLAIRQEADRSAAELDRRTRELYAKRVETGEGGEHYATQVLGHEIGHTLATIDADRALGPVGRQLKTLFDQMSAKFMRHADPLRKKGETSVGEEVRNLIAWWHGTETMPEYYEKPKERFAELFGIFLTQPESVREHAPKAYELCVDTIASSERLSAAYRRVCELKWSGKSNDAVMERIRATWTAEAQKQYRELLKMTKESVSSKWDAFCYALNNRFGPMFGISKRGIAAERKLLAQAVKEGAMSAEEAADRLAAKKAEVEALQTSLYDWQRQSGGQTRLMIAGFDEVKWNAERDGVNWNDVRDYAHLMRVIELGGRATAHGMGPARAAATLGDMARKMGAEAWTKVEKTWKAYRAVYERCVLDDPNVRELFDDMTMKMLQENKHYVTMKHRMGVEEAADWQARIEAYRKGNSDAWDPCIDIQKRLHRGLGGGSGEGGSFVLHHLTGSFEATEDPIAATMKRAIEIKESAARNHLVKQMSETLRACGAKGMFDQALRDGAKPATVDPGVYGKLTYMDGGVKHEVIVPKIVEKSFKADPLGFGWFGTLCRGIRNTMTLWNPAFVNRAYLLDKNSLETNIKGLHKPVVDAISEALCFRGVGVPLYLANNYLARFTPIAKTWWGRLLWNENTVNHYAYRANQIARMVYEGKFGEHLAEAKRLREIGDLARAAEIEENVAICQEMMRRNVFQSAYQFNRMQKGGLDTDDVLRAYGYRIGPDAATTWRGKAWERMKAAGRWANRYEEEQEACTKIIAYLYRMKQDAAAGASGEAAEAARARDVIQFGGTPDLSARGVMASYIENATGFFWNVRKEGAMRTVRAMKDHPKEWFAKNLAQTAAPALLKGLMITGGLAWAIRKLFDDDEEKIAKSWWAAPVLEHAQWMQEAMKCIPGYYQRNYNMIPLAKFGNEVVSLRVKYSPEEFAMQNLVHAAMQKYGLDPTDPTADWSTLAGGVWNELMPDIFGKNYALTTIGTLVGPLVGINPYDQYRQRNVYDQTTWEARALAPGHMAKEMAKSFWNYSPLGTFTTTFKNGQERKLEDSDVPEWLDMVLQAPLVRMIPASMLSITSSDAYDKALEEVDAAHKAYARLVARDVLAECIKRDQLGGFADGLKDLPPELKPLAIRHVVNGWRQYHVDPKALRLRKARNLKDPDLKRKALDWIDTATTYGD